MQDDLFCFALSLHFAKSHFGEIHLVTDTEGMEILGNLPYTTCSTFLDVLHDETPMFWSAGKIQALSSVDGDVLHIDGDVFLIGKKAVEILSGEWECVVQHKEAGDYWKSTYPPVLQYLSSKGVFLPELEKLNHTYNMGVVGFKNKNLLQEFVESYEILCQSISKKCRKFPPDKDPNIILEQSTLTKLIRDKNIDVVSLLNQDDIKSVGIDEVAERIGYVHLLGESKYSPKWQNIVRRKLEELNPELYEIVTHIKIP